MGKVFTWKEFRQGMIPTLDSFTQVLGQIRAELESSPAIGAIICGSVNHGHHNVRSDIDLLVFYEERDKASMVEMLRRLDVFAGDRYVPIDFIQLTPELAATNMQGISPSMAQHMECSARRGGLIGLNPFHVTDIYALDHRAEAINWTRQKVRMLDEGAVHYYDETKEAHFLQKLLEAPINGTRKLLLTTGGFEDDSKQVVLDLTQERFPELVEPLSDLVRLDEFYSGVVKAEVEFPGAFKEMAYRQVLDHLYDHVEDVSRYMKAIGRLLEA